MGTKSMNRKVFKLLGFFLAFVGTALPVFATHGPLLSRDRDSWITTSVKELVVAGLIPAPSKPFEDLTNLEITQMTAKAGALLLAQADLGLPPALPGDPLLPEPSFPSAAPSALPPAALSPAASANVGKLVEEFRDELLAIGADLPQLEDRIFNLQHHNESMEELQREYAKKTGTEASGFSRGYFHDFRGFGDNHFYGPDDYNALIFTEMRLRSVPVPSVLFDARIRVWTSIGMYYANPIKPQWDLRWISLSGLGEFGSITAGDFWQHYTPLTLWNSEVPVFTFVEPTSYRRSRKDVEEFVFMDHGSDWRLRGFKGTLSLDLKNNMAGPFKLQAMAGPLKQATPLRFGSYFGGSQATLSFFENNLEIKGSGLLLWDDPGTASTPYIANMPATYPRQYTIGSVSARANVPFDKDISLSGTGEWAGSNYQDDLTEPLRTFQDWAFMGTGSLNVYGVHLTAKYLNIGPYYYSPGAQTNRFTPAPGSGYLNTSDNGKDHFLIGYLNQFVFQGNNRPTYAAFDRVVENMLPYGDATPNREGLLAGISAEIGERGWLKPQGSLVVPIAGVQMHEIQPNFVVNGTATDIVAVDSTTNTATARVFGGFEGAITADLAKAFDLDKRVCQVAVDYKNQTTDLGGGAAPFTVNTLIAAGDFTVPVTGFDSIVVSLAYQQSQSTGSEYVNPNIGNPSSLANYAFFMDTSSIGSYVYTPLNTTRTSLAFGFTFPVSKTIQLRGDWFINHYTWADVPTYDRRDQIWRFTYEASF
jgi:hypothetical protein